MKLLRWNLCPPPPHNFILFELDFNMKFVLLRLLHFLSDLKSTILCIALAQTKVDHQAGQKKFYTLSFKNNQGDNQRWFERQFIRKWMFSTLWMLSFKYTVKLNEERKYGLVFLWGSEKERVGKRGRESFNSFLLMVFSFCLNNFVDKYSRWKKY